MANSLTPAELKNCKFENSSLLFGPLARYLGSDKRRVRALASQNRIDLDKDWKPSQKETFKIAYGVTQAMFNKDQNSSSMTPKVYSFS